MKKLICILLCVAMLSTMFVGCGKKQEEGITLVYWSSLYDGTPGAEVLKQLAKEFKEETGATIDIQFKGNERRQILPTALESGEKIDIFDSAGFYELRTYDPEWIMDLTPYYEESDYADKTYALMLKDLEENSPEGGLPGVVKTPSMNGIWYDKDAFAKAGVTELPTNFDEFEVACDKLLDSGVAPFALDIAYVPNFFSTFMQRYCGQKDVARLSNKGGWSENESAVAAAQRMIDWVNKGYFVDGAPDVFPTSQNKIALDQAAMVYCGVWVGNEIETAMGVDINWGFAKFPIYSEEIDDDVDSAYSSYIHVNEKCEHPDIAWKWLMKIVTGDGDQRFSDAVKNPPADKNNKPLPDFDGSVEYLDSVEVCLDTNCAVANADMKTALSDIMVKIFEGEYDTGLEAMQAMDALYK